MIGRKSTERAHNVNRTVTRTPNKTTRTLPKPSTTTKSTNSGFRRTTVYVPKPTTSVMKVLCTSSFRLTETTPSNSTNGTETGVSTPCPILMAGPSVSISVIIGVSLPVTAFLAIALTLFLRYRLHILTLRPNPSPVQDQCPEAPPVPSISEPSIELKYSAVYSNVGRTPRVISEPMDSYKLNRTNNIYMNISSKADISPRRDHSYCNVTTPSAEESENKDNIDSVKPTNIYTKLRDVSVVNVNPYNVFTDNAQNSEETKACNLLGKNALPLTNDSIESVGNDNVVCPEDLTLSTTERVYFEVEEEKEL